MNATTRGWPQLHVAAITLLAGLACGASAPVWAQTPLADGPVTRGGVVPGNVALALSVEYPTLESAAHLDTNYQAGKSYKGYFDTNKCYRYSHSNVEAARHFYPVGLADNYRCIGQAGRWSGNFMNWATMHTIDPFRWTMTGGYRSTDTLDTTILEKARVGGPGGATNFPNRQLNGSTEVQQATPLPWANVSMRVNQLGLRMRFTANGDVNAASEPYIEGAALNPGTVYDVFVRVKVCDPSPAAGGLESNCKAYPANTYKPTGLMHKYADRLRFSAFGYLNDDNILRDGGVLRARQKFVGPTIQLPNQAETANPAAEWSADTGIFLRDPNSADASATASALGIPITRSGVINYLNGFGQHTNNPHKLHDPVSELYYAAVRYFKNQGNVPEWTTMPADAGVRARFADEFPVITNWDDPILYSCQANFILGIGDTNLNPDKNVPGNTARANEPAKPAAVASDTTIDAMLATNKVGQLHGLGPSLGEVSGYGGCCNSNAPLMAGMAYDINTRDIRPDNPAQPQSLGMQTVQTYWLDVLEWNWYKANSGYYLAAKYGGFKPPAGFEPYARTTDIPQAWWSNLGETTGGPSAANNPSSPQATQPRPRNFFTAGSPDQMMAGLTDAFSAIANNAAAFSTGLSVAAPQVGPSGAGSYTSRYEASSWSGEVTGNLTTFDPATGAPNPAEAWSFSTKLTAQIAGTGWDTNRVMVSFHTINKRGVPFRSTALAGNQMDTLDTVYRSDNDRVDYLNYLRGDATHEENSSAPASSRTYRSRTSPVGDIVGSKVRTVGPPTAPYSDAANAGYAAFRTAWRNRTPMLYVGTNAGVMHAINASVTSPDGGKEVFAYVPGALFEGANGVPIQTGLQHRGDPDFTHKNMVDGPIGVYDVDLGKTVDGGGTVNWRSMLVGALGKGGRAYYAIDVTDPAAFSNEGNAADRVMWEFTDPDLGYTYGEPAMVKTRKYGWVMIFGSGHNNANGQGYFFIVNPRTGNLLEKIGTGVGTPSNPAGMSQVQAFIPDRTNFTAESIYAGDLLGNLWRLDLTPASGAYAAPTQLAALTDSSGNAVPITSRPLVVVQPNTNKRFVTVGSGKLLANSDLDNTQPQGFYAIIDGTGNMFNTVATLPTGMSFPIRNVGPGNRLQKLTDLTQPITLNLATQIGWWLDLGTATGGQGWRVIFDSTSYLGTVAFAAMVPSGNVCSPSGTNRVYAIDLGSGRSVLGTSTTPVPFLSTLPGVITDLRFFSVDGKPHLVGGTDTGATGPLAGNWSTTTGVRRLNWRELPLAD